MEVQGWRYEGGGLRLEVGALRVEGEGLRVESRGSRVEGRVCGVGAGGWRVEDGGWNEGGEERTCQIGDLGLGAARSVGRSVGPAQTRGRHFGGAAWVCGGEKGSHDQRHHAFAADAARGLGGRRCSSLLAPHVR